jgi:hypothetical protein
MYARLFGAQCCVCIAVLSVSFAVMSRFVRPSRLDVRYPIFASLWKPWSAFAYLKKDMVANGFGSTQVMAYFFLNVLLFGTTRSVAHGRAARPHSGRSLMYRVVGKNSRYGPWTAELRPVVVRIPSVGDIRHYHPGVKPGDLLGTHPYNKRTSGNTVSLENIKTSLILRASPGEGAGAYRCHELVPRWNSNILPAAHFPYCILFCGPRLVEFFGRLAQSPKSAD